MGKMVRKRSAGGGRGGGGSGARRAATRGGQRISRNDFAFPNGTRRSPGTPAFPVDTEVRARNAMARANQSPGGRPNLTTGEKKTLANKVRRKHPDLAKRSQFVRRFGS